MLLQGPATKLCGSELTTCLGYEAACVQHIAGQTVRAFTDMPVTLFSHAKLPAFGLLSDPSVVPKTFWFLPAQP